MLKISAVVVMLTISLNILAEPLLNQELLRLYEADQLDRKNHTFSWYNDDERIVLAQRQIDEQKLIHAKDYYHAAMIFQHGKKSEHYKTAYELARKAIQLQPDFRDAKFLACASEDRYLLSIGEPQIWGTQYLGPAGNVTMQPYDENAKTDAQRIENGIPTLAQQKNSLININQQTNKTN